MTISNENKKMFKQAVISICIGAVMTFISTFFAELAELFKTHSTEIISGGVASASYLLAKIKV